MKAWLKWSRGQFFPPVPVGGRAAGEVNTNTFSSPIAGGSAQQGAGGFSIVAIPNQTELFFAEQALKAKNLLEVPIAVQPRPVLEIPPARLSSQPGPSSADTFVTQFQGGRPPVTTLTLTTQPPPPPTITLDLPMRSQPPPPPPPPLLERPPLIKAQDCIECQPWRRLKERTQKDIQTEESQQQQQQMQEIQSQLSQFENLEQQSTQTRDIQKELRDKYNLLSQINSEIATLEQHQENQQQQVFPQSQQQSQEVPLIVPPPPDGGGLFHQGEPPPQLPAPQNPVIFCVSCASTNDALQFLNGEPSQCSVMPGAGGPPSALAPSFIPQGGPPLMDDARTTIVDRVRNVLRSLGNSACQYGLAYWEAAGAGAALAANAALGEEGGLGAAIAAEIGSKLGELAHQEVCGG